MLSVILYILIGIKLDMMNGLYLALIIINIVLWIISSTLKIVRLCLKMKGD